MIGERRNFECMSRVLIKKGRNYMSRIGKRSLVIYIGKENDYDDENDDDKNWGRCQGDPPF